MDSFYLKCLQYHLERLLRLQLHHLVIRVGSIGCVFTCLTGSNVAVIAGASVAVVVVVLGIIIVVLTISYCCIKSKTRKGEPGFLYPS